MSSLRISLRLARQQLCPREGGRDSHSSRSISRNGAGLEEDFLKRTCAASLGYKKIHGELLVTWVEAKPP